MSSTLKRTLDVPHHNDRPTSPYSPADHGLDDDFICAECKAVAWSTMPSLEANGSIKWAKHKTIRSLDATFAELVTSRCRICRMLAHIKPASLDGHSCVLKAIAANYLLPELSAHGRVSFVLLAMKPKYEYDSFYDQHPTIAVLRSHDQQTHIRPRLLQSNIIDYDLIKQFIQYCDCNHGKICPGSSGTITVSGGLRVIDIRTRTVIEAPSHCRYAALSYVWGSQIGGNALDEGLGSPPQVIEDAFAVCASLKLDFLWIDRYVSCRLLSSSPEIITNSYNN